ncbi:double homeobox protein B [Sciurus carolinensis]|uniref:double homeobox protein B n=1 Tax=Sciurus carolinensis TaxID=30640 RepID=UPI001FB47058|nr:double homeobox protein B [Sciurus carolinensis]
MVYSQSQRKTLLACFEHDPNPDKATREQLAKEIGIPGYKIQIWFKNQRFRRKKLETGCSLGKDPIQGHDQSQLPTKEYVTKEARQDQITLTTTQGTLVQAFERNHVPGAATRKKLAKPTGIQELSIQMWFQNQRSLYPEWSRGEPINFLVGDTSGRPELTNQLQETDLFIRPDGSYHLPSSDSFCNNQTISPAPLLSSGIMQPTQAVQGGEDSEPPLTFTNHLPELPTPGEDLSDTQVPFWTQFQEECQNHKEQTGIGVLKDPSQPHPEHKEPQDLGHIDISFIMQWWDEGRQALIEEWQPLEEIQ